MLTRAAAYCRVSTDQRDQLNSFESQKLYFKSYIESRSGWTLAGIYADEGITGTTTADRSGFLRMIDDAHRGLFDVILTKEVSRFSRNILDAVAFTRALKKLGVAVVFVGDGISTLDPDAELRLGIMASVAQEESRKTSERVKWGQQRKMERGVVFGRSLLGYDVENGHLTVEPDGAETVRLIFSLYADEKLGVRSVAAELTRRGLPSPSGGRAWTGASVLKILRNEKYCGDLKQRKTVTTDFLTHRKETNKGAADFIFVPEHHEPIVSRALWDSVQAELSRRSPRRGGQSPGSRYALSGRVFCGGCGTVFRCRTRIKNDGSTYRVWCCSGCACVKRPGQLREEALVRCLRRFFARLDGRVMLEGFRDLLKQTETHEQARSAELSLSLSRLFKKSAKLADIYFEGEIDREAYTELKTRYDMDINRLRALLQELAVVAADEKPSEIDVTLEAALSGTADSDFYLSLVERIDAMPDGVLRVTFFGLSPLAAVPN